MDIFEYIGYTGNVKPYDKRIPKAQLFLHGGLSKAERDLLTERVEQVRLMYVLNRQTYPMKTVLTADEHYDSIFVIFVQLKKDVSLPRLSRIIQETLPSPSLIVFALEGKYLFSSALKRLNKNEKGKVIVEEYHFTDWINLEALTSAQSLFLSTIRYGKLPALDYKQAYWHIHHGIYEESNAEIISCLDAENFYDLKQKTEAQKAVQQEIEKLTKQLNQKTVSLKEKVELAKMINKLGNR